MCFSIDIISIGIKNIDKWWFLWLVEDNDQENMVV